MILSKHVEIKANGKMISFYQNLGYEFNVNEPFLVKIEDLSYGSKVKIEVICEKCLNNNIVSYNNYNKQIKKYNFYVCKNCFNVKLEKTIYNKYGVTNISELENIKKLKKKLSLNKYGTDTPSQSDEIRNKINKTNNEKYGGNSPMCSDEIKEKSYATVKYRYGENHISKCDFIKEKKKRTCLNKYGFEFISQVSEIRKSQMKSAFKIDSYIDTDLYYQGSYELNFLNNYYDNFNIINGPTVKYSLNESEHIYHTDFYLPDYNLIVEIKSKYTYEYDLDKNLAKQQQCIKDGYNFIFIIDKNYTEFDKIINI